LARGDVLITKDSEAWDDIGVPALVVESADDLVSGYHLALLRPFTGRICGAYLFRALQSSGVAYQFHVEANGVTRYGLSHAAIKSVWLPLPPLPEQAAIVRFLDHADRRIRRYIRAKQKLIKLLEEQKQAIIHHAVTRGVDPSVPLKPSGVEWLPQVPQHWEVRRAKAICSAIVDCKNRTPAAVEGGAYLVVRTTCVRAGRFDSRGGYPTDESNYRTWTARGAPLKGDVFFTREAPAGEACLVPDRDDLCMGQRMMYFRPDPDLLDPSFLLHTIYGPLTKTYVELATNGSTVGHLRLGQVYALPILWCPINEQRAIVRHIETETEGISRAHSQAGQEIALLREYRTRLIADVVTGKLDVREAAARLPEVKEPDPLDDAEGGADAQETGEAVEAVPEEAEA
jgi:type I restriction enzyme S subunit